MPKEKTRMYRAYFNDGQCLGPCIAMNDEMALEAGKYHAKFHKVVFVVFRSECPKRS
jgi:hypothetical protein